MKKLALVCGFALVFGVNAFGVDYYYQDYDEDEEYAYIQDRSSKSKILSQAGCRAITTLSNGRYICLRR